MSAFESTTAAAGVIELRGVVENHCGTNFGPGTYFQVSTGGRDFEIPINGLLAGQELRFARAFQVPGITLSKAATLTLEVILPGSPSHDTPDHYVSPCTPTLIKP